MTINTSLSPYFDDFDADKGFHRVLFKPGVPIQARELNQSQSILQNQIKELTSSLFSEGDPVTRSDVPTTN
jgi:hypothetical protein